MLKYLGRLLVVAAAAVCVAGIFDPLTHHKYVDRFVADVPKLHLPQEASALVLKHASEVLYGYAAVEALGALFFLLGWFSLAVPLLLITFSVPLVLALPDFNKLLEPSFQNDFFLVLVSLVGTLLNLRGATATASNKSHKD